ncbi:MAG TPA: sugar ABC transporter permease [Skermanella sp.]|jgi:multiple sugar transport system permease protein|nr:sugar ABC transporter permease [Skermanella sp.]
MPGTLSWEASRRRAYLTGLVPALVVLAVITVVPTLFLAGASLTPLSLVDPASLFDFSNPLRNYAELLHDPRFLGSLVMQLQLSALTVTLQLAVGLGLALLLNVRSSFFEAIRTVFLIPMVLPPIVVALIWKIIYTPDVSPLHRFLDFVGLPADSFITSASTALLAVAVADTWQWFPFTMLMILATLQMIPNEPLEAAKIDGANHWQTFRYIIFAYIRPALIVSGLFRLIDSFKAFPLIYVLTDGGPGSATEVTNYYAFVQAFNFSYWGYASAIAIVLLTGVFTLSWAAGRLGWNGDEGE